MKIETLLHRSNILGWELRAGIESFAHHSAAALGLGKITVTWSDSISTAAINQHGSIFLTNVSDDARINRALLLKFVGFVIHELLHRKYTNFGAYAGGYLGRLHNACEDIWIERQGIKSGLLGNITAVLTELIGGMVAEALVSVDDWADPAQYPFALAVCGRRYAPTVPLAKGLKTIFNEASIRIDACNNSHDTLEVAKWVLSQLQQPENNSAQDKPEDKPGDEGQPGDEADEAPGDEGEAGDEAGEGKPGDEGAPGGEGQDGEGEGQDGEGQGEGDGEGDAAGDGAGQGGEATGEAAEGPGEAGEGNPGDEAQGQHGEGQGAGPGNPIAEAPDAGERRCPDRKQDSRKVEPNLNPGDARSRMALDPTAIVESGYHINTVTSHTNKPYSIDCPVSAKLRAEVKRLFDNSGSSEFQRGRRAGSLDTNRLHPIAAGNDKVFMRRLATEGVDSAVVVMLDLSTSMNRWDKITYAVPACAALVETLTAAGVDVCVTAFADEVSIIKPWAMTSKKALTLLPKVHVYGGTNDSMALSHAHGLLLRHGAPRRVCFVLTDGDGNDVSATIAQVEAGQRLGITTIGVGILHGVGHVYPQSVRVNKLSDLGNLLFKHIKLAA